MTTLHKSMNNKIQTFFKQEFMLTYVFIFDIFFEKLTKELKFIVANLCFSVNSISFSSTASVEFHIF